MSAQDDGPLVDYLYGELGSDERARLEAELEADPARKGEVAQLGETLATFRQLDLEDPSPHLDALMIARAREEAEKLAGASSWLRRILRSPLTGLAAAACAAGIAALVLVPSVKRSASRAEESAGLSPAVRAPEPILRAQPQSIEASPSGQANEVAAEEPRAEGKLTNGEAPRQLAPKRRVVEGQADGLAAGAAPERAPLEARREAKKSAVRSADAPPPAPASAPPLAKEQPSAHASWAPAEADLAEPSAPSSGGAKAKDAAESSKPVAPSKRAAAGPSASARDDALDDEGASAGRARSEKKDEEDALSRAETAIREGDRGKGRAILLEALSRARGREDEPRLLLRIAELDFDEERFADAAAIARRAAGFIHFARRREALELAARAEKRSKAARK